MICTIKTTVLFLLMITASSAVEDKKFHNILFSHGLRYQPHLNGGERVTCPPFMETAPGELGMVVLPSGEICVCGQMMADGRPLPDDPLSQLEILASYAIWFNPCTHTTTKLASQQCFRIGQFRLSQLKNAELSNLRYLTLAYLGRRNKASIHGTRNLSILRN